jgi:hypothetical protein
MEWFKDPIHKKIVGIGLLIINLIYLIGTLFILVIAPFFGILSVPVEFSFFSLNFGGMMGGLLFLAGFISFIFVVWGIITAALIISNKRAGYIMGIVICFFSLFNFPVGTILGVYGLLVLITALQEPEPAPYPGRDYIR